MAPALPVSAHGRVPREDRFNCCRLHGTGPASVTRMRAADEETKKVLIADDDDWMREMLGLLLAEEGLCPVEARSGSETVAVASQERPDVIVLDVGLPDASGFEVLAQLRDRSSTRETPVLLISGQININESGHAFESEAVFHKPIDFAAFLEKVRDAAGECSCVRCTTASTRKHSQTRK